MKPHIILLFICISSLGAVEDEVNCRKALEHIEALAEYSPRLAGSGTVNDSVIGGSYSAALYIAETLKEYGYTTEIEEFSFTTFQIRQFSLIVDFDGDFSTPDQLDLSDRAIPPTHRYSNSAYDVVVPLVFLDEARDTSGVMPGFEYWAFYDPRLSSTVGRSSLSLVYKVDEPAFVTRFRETFSISYADYLLLQEKKTPETVVWVKFTSTSEEVKGYNVIGIKKGGQRKVILTAHYDSVYTDGAIDNGSGVAALLETARILSGKTTDATLYFVFLDAEEIGLLGSEAFVESHELLESVCINVDSIGSGDTVYIGASSQYEEMWLSYYYTDSRLDTCVAEIAEGILGYTPGKWYLEDVGGYSDFVTFTREGIPTTDISTLDKEAAKIPVISEEKQSEHAYIWVKGGKVVYFDEDRFSKVVPYIHTGHDDINHVNRELFCTTTEIVTEAAYRLSRSGGVGLVHIVGLGAIALAICALWCMKRIFSN